MPDSKELFNLRRELSEAHQRIELYEIALNELSGSLSVKSVLYDLVLSQQTLEALRQALEAMRSKKQ